VEGSSEDYQRSVALSASLTLPNLVDWRWMSAVENAGSVMVVDDKGRAVYGTHIYNMVRTTRARIASRTMTKGGASLLGDSKESEELASSYEENHLILLMRFLRPCVLRTT
jgi:hypothetical protein